MSEFFEIIKILLDICACGCEFNAEIVFGPFSITGFDSSKKIFSKIFFAEFFCKIKLSIWHAYIWIRNYIYKFDKNN